MIFAAQVVVKYIPKDSKMELESEDVYFSVTGHTQDAEAWANEHRDTVVSWLLEDLEDKNYPAGLYSGLMLFTICTYHIPSSPNGPEEWDEDLEPDTDIHIHRLTERDASPYCGDEYVAAHTTEEWAALFEKEKEPFSN